MRKKFLWCFAWMILAILLIAATKCYAADLDEILNYIVTVEPRMNDGTLDITYEITWKVLDSTTEGPLEWVQIGTPNDYFDNPTALTSNIGKISAYNGSNVRIDFKRKYYAGDELTFRYKIYQPYMYKLKGNKCNYTFTPAWFTNARVDNMTIKWNADQVKSSNNGKKQDNYLVWKGESLAKGEKLTAKITYPQSAFGSLNQYKQVKTDDSSTGSSAYVIRLFIVIFILSVLPSLLSGGGYYGHRGFGGGYYGGYYGGYRSHCVHSSCACAHSSCACARSSCACACAGSGRAGCSKKDFYGTKINQDKLKKVLK